MSVVIKCLMCGEGNFILSTSTSGREYIDCDQCPFHVSVTTPLGEFLMSRLFATDTEKDNAVVETNPADPSISDDDWEKYADMVAGEEQDRNIPVENGSQRDIIHRDGFVEWVASRGPAEEIWQLAEDELYHKLTFYGNLWPFPAVELLDFVAQFLPDTYRKLSAAYVDWLKFDANENGNGNEEERK